MTKIIKKDCFAYVNDKTCSALITMDCHNCSFYKTTQQLLRETDSYCDDEIKCYSKLSDVEVNKVNMAWFSKRQQEVAKLRLGIGDGIKRNLQETADCLGLTKQYIQRIDRDILNKINFYSSC